MIMHAQLLIPVRLVHCCVSKIDEHQNSLPSQHALLKLAPIACLLRLKHPQSDIFGQLG